MRLPHITSVAAEVSDWGIRRVAEDSFSDRETFFPGWGFSERMRRSVLLLELPLILAGLVFVEFGAVLHELRTDVVLDWFVTLAPLIWINASVLVVYSFLRLYRDPNLVPARPETSTIRGQGFLLPNFRAIREGGSALRRSWTAAMIVYALAFAFLQGGLVIDPSGSIEPVSTVLDSPVGYGPGFVWAPTTTFGVVVRPFSVATALALSLLSGIVVALSIRLFVVSRKSVAGLPGPFIGFAVACPACLGAPISGLFLAYLAPLASMGGIGAASAFSRMLVISTALLIFTLLLLWIVLSLLSHMLGGPSGAVQQA